MNRIHRVVWNTIRCAFVAVNETTASRGKASKSERKGARRTPLAKLALATMLAIGGGTAFADQNLDYNYLMTQQVLNNTQSSSNKWVFVLGTSVYYKTEQGTLFLPSYQVDISMPEGDKTSAETTLQADKASGTLTVGQLDMGMGSQIILLGGGLTVNTYMNVSSGTLTLANINFGGTNQSPLKVNLEDNTYITAGQITGWADINVTKPTSNASNPYIKATTWELKGSLTVANNVSLTITNLTSQGAKVTNNGTITGTSYTQTALEGYTATYTGKSMTVSNTTINDGTFQIESLGTNVLWVGGSSATAKIDSLGSSGYNYIDVTNYGTTSFAATKSLGKLENHGTLTTTGNISVAGDFLQQSGTLNAENIDVHTVGVVGNKETFSWVQINGGTANITGELKADVVKISSGAALNVNKFTQYNSSHYIENAGTFQITGEPTEISQLTNSGTVEAVSLALKDSLTLKGGTIHTSDALTLQSGLSVTSSAATTLSSDKSILIDGSATGNLLTLNNITLTAGESLTLNRQTTVTGSGVTVTAPTLNANANADFTGVTLKADSIHVTQGTTKVSTLVASSEGDGKTDVNVDSGTTFAYTGSAGKVGTLTLNGTFDASGASGSLAIDTIAQGSPIGSSDFKYTSGNGLTVNVSGAADFTKLNVTGGTTNVTFGDTTEISEVDWSAESGALNLNGASTIGNFALSNGTANVASTATVDSLVLTGGTFNVKENASVTLGYVGSDTAGTNASNGSITVANGSTLTLSSTASNTNNNHFNIGNLSLSGGSTLTNNNRTVNITKLTQSDAVTYNQTGDAASFKTSSNAVFNNSTLNLEGGTFDATATAGTGNTYNISNADAGAISGDLLGDDWKNGRTVVIVDEVSGDNTYNVQNGGVLEFDSINVGNKDKEFINLEGGALATDLTNIFTMGESKQVAMEEVSHEDGLVSVTVGKNFTLTGTVTGFVDGVEDSIHFDSGSLVFTNNFDIGMLNSVQGLVSDAVKNDKGSGTITIHYTGTSTKIFTPDIANTVQVTDGSNVEAILSSTTLYAAEGAATDLQMKKDGDTSKDLTISIGFKDIANATSVTVNDGMKLALVGSAGGSSYLVTSDATGATPGTVTVTGTDAKLYLGSQYLAGYGGKLGTVNARNAGLVQVRAGTYDIDTLDLSSGTFQVDADATSTVTTLTAENGTLSNSGTLTVTNAASLTGTSSVSLAEGSTTTFASDLTAAGGFTSAGTLSVNGAATLSGGEASFTGGTATFTGKLTAANTLKQTGTSQINVQGSGSSIATFTQESGSRLSVADGADLTITDASGLNGTVVASGALAVTGGTSATDTTGKTGAVYLTQDGSLTVSGNLALKTVGLELESDKSADTVQAADLAAVGATTITGGTLAADTLLLGATSLEGGQLVNNGQASRIYTLTMTGGTLVNNGTLTIDDGVENNGATTITGLSQTESAVLNLAGKVEWSGTNSARVNGAVKVTDGGADFVSDSSYDFNNLSVEGVSTVAGSLTGKNLAFGGAVDVTGSIGAEEMVTVKGLLTFSGESARYSTEGADGSKLSAQGGLTVSDGADITINNLTMAAGQDGSANLTTVSEDSSLTGSNMTLSSADISGQLSVSGTSSVQTLTMSETGGLTNAGTLTLVSVGTMYNLTQSEPDAVLKLKSATVTLSGTSVNNGSIDAADTALTVSGTTDTLTGTGALTAKSLTIGNGTTAEQGNVTVTALTTVGTGAALTSAALALNEAQVEGTLTGAGTITSLTGSAGSTVSAQQNGLTVTTLTTEGTLDLTSGALTATNLTLTGAQAVLAGGNTLNVKESLHLTSNAAVTYGAIDASKAATTIDAGSSLTAQGGSFASVTANGTFAVAADSKTVSVTGGFGGAGTVSVTSGTLASTGTDTIATYTQTGGAAQFANLTLTDAAQVTGGTWTADNLTVSGRKVVFDNSDATVSSALSLTDNAKMTAKNFTSSGTSALASGAQFVLASGGKATLNALTMAAGSTLDTSGALTIETAAGLDGVIYTQRRGGSLTMSGDKSAHFFTNSTLNIYAGTFNESDYVTGLGTGNTFNVGNSTSSETTFSLVPDTDASITIDVVNNDNTFNLYDGGALYAGGVSQSVTDTSVYLLGGSFVTSIDSFFEDTVLEAVDMEDGRQDGGEVDLVLGNAVVGVGDVKAELDTVLNTEQADARGTIVFDDEGNSEYLSAGAAKTIVDAVGDMFADTADIEVLFTSEVTPGETAGLDIDMANEIIGQNKNVHAVLASENLGVTGSLTIDANATEDEENTLKGSIGFGRVTGTNEATVKSGTEFALVGSADDNFEELLAGTEGESTVTVEKGATFTLGSTYLADYTGSIDKVSAQSGAVNIKGGHYKVGELSLDASSFKVYGNSIGDVANLTINGATDAEVNGTLNVTTLNDTGSGTIKVAGGMTVTNKADIKSTLQAGNADQQAGGTLNFTNGFTAKDGALLAVVNGAVLTAGADAVFESGSQGLKVDNGTAYFKGGDGTAITTTFTGAALTIDEEGKAAFDSLVVTADSSTGTEPLVNTSGVLAADSVALNQGAGLTTQAQSQTLIGALTADGASSVTNAGSLTITEIAADQATITNHNGGLLTLGGGTVGSLINEGAGTSNLAESGNVTATVHVTDSLVVKDSLKNDDALLADEDLTLEGDSSNTSVMQVTGTLATQAFDNSGTLTAGSLLANGAFTNSGDVSAQTMTFESALTNAASGSLVAATITSNDTIDNGGSIVADNLTLNGAVTNQAGAEMSFTQMLVSSSFVNEGDINPSLTQVAGGQTIDLKVDGDQASLTNTGTVNAHRLWAINGAEVTNTGEMNLNRLHVEGGSYTQTDGTLTTQGVHFISGSMIFDGSSASEQLRVTVPLMVEEEQAKDASVGGSLVVSNAYVSVGVSANDVDFTDSLVGVPDASSVLVAALPQNTSLRLGENGSIYVGGDAQAASSTVGAGDTYFDADSMLVMSTGLMQTIAQGGSTVFYGNGGGTATFESGSKVYIANLGYGRYYFAYDYDNAQSMSADELDRMLADLKENTTWDKTKYPTKTVSYEVNEDGDIVLVVSYDNVNDIYPGIVPSETWDEVLQDETLHDSNRDDVIGFISRTFEDQWLDEGSRVEVINTVSQIGAAGQQYTQAARMVNNVNEMAERHLSFEDAHFSHGNLLRWQGARVWADALGQQFRSSGYDFTGGMSDYDGQNWGAVLGVDFIGDNMLRSGLAFAAQRGTLETHNSLVPTSNDTDAFSLVGYIAKNSGNWNFIGTVSASYVQHDIKQTLPSSLQMGPHTMDADNYVFSAAAKAEYRVELSGGIAVVPYAGLRSVLFRHTDNTSRLAGADAFNYDVDTQLQWQFPIGVAMQFEGENRGWTGKGLVDLSVIPVAGDTRYDGMLSGAGLSARDDYAADFTDKFSTQLRVGGMLGNGTFSYGADVSARVNDSGDTDMTVNLKARMAF